MKINIITIFPEIFDFYLKQSLLFKAQQKGVLKIKAHNLRDFTKDKHKIVDDRPFGGGRGMVIKLEPLYRAIQILTNNKKPPPKADQPRAEKTNKRKVILFSPRGKKFTQKKATEWAKLDQLILICGRYEGIDERINKIVDERISIGDFVMMGGDLAGLIVIESVARLLPGVVGKSEDLIGKRITKEKGFIEYPQYTRPEVFTVPAVASAKAGNKKTNKWRVPKVLLSGNHKKIEEWRRKHSKIIGK